MVIYALKVYLQEFVETLFNRVLDLIYTVFVVWDDIILLSDPVEFSMLDLFIALTIIGVVVGMFMIFPRRDHFEKI